MVGANKIHPTVKSQIDGAGTSCKRRACLAPDDLTLTGTFRLQQSTADGGHIRAGTRRSSPRHRAAVGFYTRRA
jgi:hypothetical protein